MEMEMDPLLMEAAMEGDVKFLKQAFTVQPPEYFLAQDKKGNSIFNYAAGYGKVDFMKEAMNILPTNIVKQLILMTDYDSYTPLHSVATHGNISVIKCIREMYASLSWDDDENHVKPWLALTRENNTPLKLAILWGGEKSAMEMLLMDPELESCTIADKYGNTPLYYAVKVGISLVAQHILKSSLTSISIVGSSDFLSLVCLATECTENVVKLLRERCDGLIDNDGNTTLHSALQSTSTQELALEILSTYPTMCKLRNNKGESPFFLAVCSGCERVVDEIMRIEEPRFNMLRRNDGTTVLHSLTSCPEKTGRMLLEKYWWLINLRDGQGKTALDYATQENTDWLVNLLANPSLIKKQDFDWVEACKRKESDAVLAFIDNCQDLRKVCRKGNDTLLHHVVLPTYKDYLHFLKISAITELKNTTNDRGETPLHLALWREDMHYAKALLRDNEVNRIIKDCDGGTSMDMLANLCKENVDWERMCNEINVNPYLRTTYILPETNLEQMRTTLSVIAALLATITFAAGFTLPGGINDNGQALLGKKAAFLVFLLADAYAMCTSMLVLFCLVWSMVSKQGMARLLVDRSVFILMHSLYATLLVFVTGIYVVIEHTFFWAAIVILVMCSIIGITANKTILHKVIGMFVPAEYRQKLDEMRLLEEGNAGAFTTTEEDNRDKRE